MMQCCYIFINHNKENAVAADMHCEAPLLIDVHYGGLYIFTIMLCTFVYIANSLYIRVYIWLTIVRSMGVLYQTSGRAR